MRGFTIIEILIYVALMGFILLSTLTLFFPLMRSLELQNTLTSEQIEALFVQNKITWLLSQNGHIDTPTASEASSTLQVTTAQHTQYTLTHSHHTLTLQTNTDSPLPLTRERSVVDFFFATHTPHTHMRAPTLEISFSLNGTSYGPFLYVLIP